MVYDGGGVTGGLSCLETGSELGQSRRSGLWCCGVVVATDSGLPLGATLDEHEWRGMDIDRLPYRG